jgi:methyl-coenzyme M reductase beta subunit
MLWNAYAAAGTLAATMVNCGAGRFAQAVSSTLLYFNDLLEHETGLPGCDYGRVMGVCGRVLVLQPLDLRWRQPGVFNGNHVVTRHAAGFGNPVRLVACALDAGTQMFTPEQHRKDLRGHLRPAPEFKTPIQTIAKGV